MSGDEPDDFYLTPICNVLEGSIHDGSLLHSKSQHTTVNQYASS
jgi:hypothetical protein